jgi:hypothetical protein
MEEEEEVLKLGRRRMGRADPFITTIGCAPAPLTSVKAVAVVLLSVCVLDDAGENNNNKDILVR